MSVSDEHDRLLAEHLKLTEEYWRLWAEYSILLGIRDRLIDEQERLEARLKLLSTKPL